MTEQNDKTIRTTPDDTDKFIYIGRDGGTGKHVHRNAGEALASVNAADKKRAVIMLCSAAVTLAVVFLSRLLWLFEPLFDNIYYGKLSSLIYYIILGVLFTVYVLVLNAFIKSKCGVRIFRIKRSNSDLTRALGTIAVAAATVFIVSAVFKFKLKIQIEMGLGVTLATALTNIAVYIYYALHLWLAFTAATLVQYGMSMLFPAKYSVPWGAVLLVAVYGTIELILELYCTDHVYALVYYLFTYAYAAVYMLTGRSFHVSYWASVIIMIL